MVLFEDEDVANNSSDNLIEELVDEDITIIIDKEVGIVHPMKTIADDMVKRENDIVSGNVAFNEDLSKFIKTFFIFINVNAFPLCSY